MKPEVTVLATKELWVEGIPKPKPRPRLGRHWNFYTPDTGFEDLVGGLWYEKYGREPFPKSIPIFLTISFHLPSAVTSRPDLDNLIKSAMDGLGKWQGGPLAWEDDSQVAYIFAIKDQISKGQSPGCLISVKPVPFLGEVR